MHKVRVQKNHPSRETVCLNEAINPSSYLLTNKKRRLLHMDPEMRTHQNEIRSLMKTNIIHNMIKNYTLTFLLIWSFIVEPSWNKTIIRRLLLR